MNDKPDYLGHRKRLRERFQKAGSDGFQDYELLELLLTYAIPRKDVKPVAKELIKCFGGLSGILDANHKTLVKIHGMGAISATLIRLVKELCAVYLGERMEDRDLLSSPQVVADFARMKLTEIPHESFMIIYLNTRNEVLKYEIVQEGTLDHAVVYPRRIIEGALSQHASGLILVHNHPSGHCRPSNEDLSLTRNIVEAVRMIDIRILDHIVVGREGYFSFKENNLL